MDKFFVINQVQASLWNEIGTQRAMTTSVTQKAQLDGIFDVISYPKGNYIIHTSKVDVTLIGNNGGTI